MLRKLLFSGFLFGLFSILVSANTYAATGGPDTYGYTYSDSNSSATYSWVSHTGAATTVTGRGDDTLYGPYSIGFTFNFYGSDYTSVYICNNGFITFSSGNCSYTNVDIITAGVPNNFIAPFWDDLYTAGTIKYELFDSAPNRYMVISFEGINHISYTSGAATFQVIIYETSNDIKIQYSDALFGSASFDYGLSATVGMEDSSGSDGLKYSYDTGSLADNLAIEISAPVSVSVTQSAYRVFENADSTNVGTSLASADTSATLNLSGQQFRLRMLLHITGADLSQSAGSYKLQYIGKGIGTCSSPSGGTPSSWTDVTTLTDIAFYNNATPTDGSALTANGSDPTHSADTIVNQTYEEANNFTNSQALIASGQDGKWDFSLYDNSPSGGTSYCFRIVESDNTVLDTYTVYPEITTKETSGGPDTYGYIWNDSNGSGEAYSWNDISGTGTAITGRGDDTLYGPYSIGFTFNFYGNNKTQFYVCNNGFITFASGDCSYTNATIPTAGTPNDMIAPFWDDLYTAGNIYYETIGTTPNQKLVISFDGVDPYGSQGNPLYFQVVLHETSNLMKFQYQDVDYGTAVYGGGLSATIGIEDSTGSDGLLYSFNAATLPNNYSIDFSYDNTSPYNQSAYRLFANNDGTSVGSSLAAQDTPYTLTSDGQEFRLRMLIHNMDTLLGVSGENFKLQYVDKGAGTCSSPSGNSPSSWTDVTDLTSLAYKNNSTPIDGNALSTDAGDPTHSGHTIHNQTYEELNNFTNSQSTIPSSEDALWDFSLYDKSVSGATTLCVRAVTSGNSEFSNYNSYPEVTTAAAASSLTFSLSTNNVSFGSLSSTLSTATATTITVDSNAENGFEVYVKGEGNGATAGLYSSASSNLISALSSSSIVTDGTPGFGVYFSNGSVGVTVDEGFDNDSGSDLAITRSYKRGFYTTASTGNEESADLNYRAVINAVVPAGNYSENLDIIVIGAF